MTRAPSIALVGLGEVGTSFADALLDRGIELKVASRESSRSTASAKKIGIELDHDIARAAGTADIVLLTMTGDGLREVVAKIAPVLREHAILANLTAANPPHVIAAADMLGANRPQFVDVAIMGAVSLHGIRTPLLASGEMATDFAAVMNPLGFSVSAREGSAVGDASSLKLLRSLFAKGLDALVVESMLAAEALGLRQDLIELLSDFDQRPLRDHIDMYLRTHPPHAGRRLVEMELAEEQMKSLGLRSLTTRATIDRYRHTTDLVRRSGALPAMDAPTALQWLLDAERGAPEKNNRRTSPMASNGMHAQERLVYVTPETLKKQVELVLSAWGMMSEKVELIADLLVETDLRGIESHGASMLPLYDKMRRAGGLNMMPKSRIVRENAAMALIDGDAGLGHPVAVEAMNLAIRKCKEIGVGAVSVMNSHHFGATGLYAEMAAREGAIALVTSSARTVAVIPTGGTMPVLGTNPIAFAAPSGRGHPFLLDMSTSAVAANKVKVYAYHGTPLPVGWVVDGAGKPVSDPKEAFRMCMESDVGGLMPMGGTRETGTHKGYGLAVMAQLLGSTLAGGSFSPFRNRDAKPGASDNIGHFFLALDPEFFRTGGSFEDEVSDILDHLRATPSATPSDPVIVAGEPEFARRAERLKTGIPLNEAFLAEISSVAASAGVDFILDSKVR